MTIKQEDIEKLITDLNKDYNILAIQDHFFPERVVINLRKETLSIDTSKSIGFELKDDKLAFIGYNEHKEILDLKEYKKGER